MRSQAVHRALDAELTDARSRRGGDAPRVLDVGGGSGFWAVQLAASGCLVTVVEPSPNALATLNRRAVEAGATERITAVQGDTEALGELVERAGADLVLGHGVLEQVDDVGAAMTALADAAAPGGAVSVLVANSYATVLHRVLAGRLEDALRLLRDTADPNREARVEKGSERMRRFDTDGLRTLLTEAKLTVELLQGDAVVADLVPGAVFESTPSAVDTLGEIELCAAGMPPLRDLASRLHAIGRRVA